MNESTEVVEQATHCCVCDCERGSEGSRADEGTFEEDGQQKWICGRCWLEANMRS